MFSRFKQSPDEQDPPFIVPRIKHTNFLRALNEMPEIQADSMPIIEPLVGDLLLTYALDVGPNFISVSAGTLEQYQINQSDLRQIAETNALEAMSELRVRTEGAVNELLARDNMAACSILYPELWQQIEQELNGPVVAAFPHRDIVLYTCADSPEHVASLKAAVAQIDFDETHALSRLLYKPVDGQWHVASQ